MKNNRSLKYNLLSLFLAGVCLAGCSQTKEVTEETSVAIEDEMDYALPEVGEAAILEAKVETAQKGTIQVATVGSPNTEILQEAARLLGEKGYLLNIEVCEDYLTPNQLVLEGKVDCNYYQHEAFLDRYNIEKQTDLQAMAKIHYEPMAIFSEKLESLESVKKGSKVLIPENPTALAQALWLLQAEGLLTLMSDADMNTVMGDIAQNPYDLEIVTMKEEEILGNLADADLGLCHVGYTLKEAKEAEDIMLAMENKDSMMAQKLSQTIVVGEYPNENAQILMDTLMSEKMQQFIQTQYQGSIYMMDGEVAEIEVTSETTEEEIIEEKAE